MSINKIHSFPCNDSTFPTLFTDMDINFGSFARRTKIRELNDIDIMITLNGEYSTYYDHYGCIDISVPDTAYKLRLLCDNNILNSRKVINRFISFLECIPQYSSSDISRKQEAAVLNLSSYTWSFDIIPCFITQEDSMGKTYYLIPDGNGRWKKTDPRIDRDRVTSVNQKHDGNVLNAVRVMKYWNKRSKMPIMSSYLLENIIIDFYEYQTNKASKYVDLEFINLISHISKQIFQPTYDPKGIQGNLNILTQDQRNKISARASSDYFKSLEARDFEKAENHKSSIAKWAEIFGNNFPSFG